MSDIQPADPTTRKRVLLIIVAAVILAAVLIMIVEANRPAFEAWLLEEPDQLGRKLTWLAAAFAVLSLPLVLGAVYLWRIAVLTIDARRCPPPGVGVAVDTPIVTGTRAVRRGRLLQLAAVLLAVAALAAPLMIWAIGQQLLGGP